MTSGRLTILDRLDYHSLQGKMKTTLCLYLNQEKQLAKDGCTVQRISSQGLRHGQHLCSVDWSNPPANTEAHRLFTQAQEAVKSKSAEEHEPLNPPYSY